MLEAVCGRLLSRGDGRVRLAIGDFVLSLRTTPGAFAAGQVGERVTVYTHLTVRDDQPLLFGFEDEVDREAFLLLQAVPGLGAEKALLVLGGLGPRGLAEAVTSADAARLKTVKGVGDRLARRLVTELRDRLPASLLAATCRAPGSLAAADAEAALLRLGFAGERVREVLRTLAVEAGENASAEELVKAAIARLSAAAADRGRETHA